MYKETNVFNPNFIEKNLHPNKLYEKARAAGIVNALAISTETPWDTVFHTLIQQAHKFALMPNNDKCIRGLMIEYGFVKHSIPREEYTVEEVRSRMCREAQNREIAIVTSNCCGWKGIASAILPPDHTDPHNYKIVGFYDTSDNYVKEVWVLRPGQTPDANTRTSAASRISPPGKDKSAGNFRYHQENPLNNNTGDCVIRGLSAATQLSWDETVDGLAKYRRTTLNSHEVYRNYLREQGFTHHDTIIKDNRCVTASELCRAANLRFHNGERIFAYVGQSHVAAIVPLLQSNGIYRYVLLDTWDSSSRSISEYWVSQPAKNFPTTVYPPVFPQALKRCD